MFRYCEDGHNDRADSRSERRIFLAVTDSIDYRALYSKRCAVK
jgi:hypothetical protein